MSALNADLFYLLGYTEEELEGELAARHPPELEDLLLEAQLLSESAEAAKAAKRHLRSPRMKSPEERTQLQNVIRDWELRSEWEAVATAALFTRYHCECGFITDVFANLLEHHKHRRFTTTQRWVSVKASRADLPREVIFQDIPVPCCSECASAKGWRLDDATIQKIEIHTPGVY